MNEKACLHREAPASPDLDVGQRQPDFSPQNRPRQQGKFFFRGAEKLYVRGVTYGTFRPDDKGVQFPDAAQVDADFTLMVSHGINTLRTYTVPPRWLLDFPCTGRQLEYIQAGPGLAPARPR